MPKISLSRSLDRDELYCAGDRRHGNGQAPVLASTGEGNMAARYLGLSLVCGVVIWLGIVMFTPGPIETARNAPVQPCSVICMDTQAITWQPPPPEPIPAPAIMPDADKWPDARPI
jgi:hypothetical protein